jgi:hypothetical protein
LWRFAAIPAAPAVEQLTPVRLAALGAEGIIAMAADYTIDRVAIDADLERARIEFPRLLADAQSHDAWTKPTHGTHWTNEQLLYHMMFGYLIVRRLLVMVKVFSRLPDQVSRGFARALDATTRPFDAINYYGACAGALVYNRHRVEAKMDRVIAALKRKLAREHEYALRHGMHFPTRWDPFFKNFMTLQDVYRYPRLHFDFHKHQLTLTSARD